MSLTLQPSWGAIHGGGEGGSLTFTPGSDSLPSWVFVSFWHWKWRADLPLNSRLAGWPS